MRACEAIRGARGIPAMFNDNVKVISLLSSGKTLVHTAIETCGHVSESYLNFELPYINFTTYDLKAEEAVHHERLTSKSNRRIKKNLETILSCPVDILVRMPLIPGLNDAPSPRQAVGSFLEKAKPEVSFEILGYHRIVISRYEQLGRPYMPADMEAVS